MVPEGLRGIACVFPEVPDKVRGIFIAEVVSYLVHLAGGGKKVPFRLEDNVFIDEFRTGFTQACLCDRV